MPASDVTHGMIPPTVGRKSSDPASGSLTPPEYRTYNGEPTSLPHLPSLLSSLPSHQAEKRNSTPHHDTIILTIVSTPTHLFYMNKASFTDQPQYMGPRKNRKYRQTPLGRHRLTVDDDDDDDEYAVDDQWETIAEELMANHAGQKELDEKEDFEYAVRQAQRKREDPLGIEYELEYSPAVKRMMWKKYGLPKITRTYKHGWRNMDLGAERRATKESERKWTFMVSSRREEYEGNLSIWKTPMSLTGWLVYSQAEGHNGYWSWVEATLVITG